MKWDTDTLLAVLCFALLFLLCMNRVPAQEYTVTESQLQKLETILQNYKADRQTALSKVNSLQSSLEQERLMTKNLSESLTKYEQQVSEITQQNAQLQDQNNKLQIKIKNKTIVIIILSGIILFLIIFDVIYVLIKIKVI